MAADTLRFSGQAYAPGDIYALPSPDELIIYDHDQVRVVLGHEKFVWIRNGLIFQVAGGGYVLLNVINDLISGEPPFAKNNLAGLGIGAAQRLAVALLQLGLVVERIHLRRATGHEKPDDCLGLRAELRRFCSQGIGRSGLRCAENSLLMQQAG